MNMRLPITLKLPLRRDVAQTAPHVSRLYIQNNDRVCTPKLNLLFKEDKRR